MGVCPEEAAFALVDPGGAAYLAPGRNRLLNDHGFWVGSSVAVGQCVSLGRGVSEGRWVLVGGRVAAGIWWFDRVIVDGTVNGVGRLTIDAGRGLRRIQTG
ncbi:MAG: hypothetical protein M1281_01890, partial [Chloroflexi bacterium]|nr:hypothetical protein [Chloroflexota bacterium]